MENEKKLVILVDDNIANLKIGNNILEEIGRASCRERV